MATKDTISSNRKGLPPLPQRTNGTSPVFSGPNLIPMLRQQIS